MLATFVFLALAAQQPTPSSGAALEGAVSLVRFAFIEAFEIPDPIVSVETTFRPEEYASSFTITVESYKHCCSDPPTPQVVVTVSWRGGALQGFTARGPLIEALGQRPARIASNQRARSIAALCRVAGWLDQCIPTEDPRVPNRMVVVFKTPEIPYAATAYFDGPGFAPTFVGNPL